MYFPRDIGEKNMPFREKKYEHIDNQLDIIAQQPLRNTLPLGGGY